MSENYAQKIRPLNVILIGLQGHGKSSLGNFLLRKKPFGVPNVNFTSTTGAEYAEGHLTNYSLTVIDTPGAADVTLSDAEETLTKILEDYTDGIHLFLLVIKFADCDTGKYLTIFDTWREILGEDIFKKGAVIAITFGDEFRTAMEKAKRPDKKFNNWCRKQGGKLRELFVECGGRIMLFSNNDSEWEVKCKEFTDHAEYLRFRFTYDMFEKTSHESLPFQEDISKHTRSNQTRSVRSEGTRSYGQGKSPASRQTVTNKYVNETTIEHMSLPSKLIVIGGIILLSYLVVKLSGIRLN